MLKQAFIELLTKYTDNTRLIDTFWEEIRKNYSGRSRHYHTLDHLKNLLVQLTEIKSDIKDWNTVLFTLYYHDVVYNALKSDNEEKSAEFAANRMKQVGIPDNVIENCKQQILATKSHFKSTDSDTNYFTDADLSVLGQSWEIYELYYKNVRKEYSIYPDFIYRPGRRKVVQHFLAMERIYKTDYFFSKLEVQAKENLQKELELLR